MLSTSNETYIYKIYEKHPMSTNNHGPVFITFITRTLILAEYPIGLHSIATDANEVTNHTMFWRH